MKLQRVHCPYCEKKVSLLNCWFLKTQGEYRCPKCGGYSNIHLEDSVIIIALFTVLLSGIFFTYHLIFVKTLNFVTLMLVFLPFFLFFLVSAFFVRLQKPVSKRKPPEPKMSYKIKPPDLPVKNYNKNDNGHTIVMNYVKKM